MGAIRKWIFLSRLGAVFAVTAARTAAASVGVKGVLALTAAERVGVEAAAIVFAIVPATRAACFL
jgi:hypothetical protein